MRAARRIVGSIVAVLVVLGSGAPASAGAPVDQLQTQIGRVLKILSDPDLQGDTKAAARRTAIRGVANEIFDFPETTRRSLARHWHGRTAAERAEVTALFADLLERAYIGKIELYSGERIQFLGDVIDGEQATVRTKLVTKQGTEIPVDYRMHRRDGRWLAYDVAIEGVSLVANYRAQFARIIQISSFQGLVDRLRARQEEGQEADAGGRRASEK